VIGPGFSESLARARSGDELAWSVLYDDLAGPLLGYLRGRGAPDPEDQLGETFLQIARDLASFSGDEAGFRSWVFTIAHRRLLDAARTRRRRPATVLPPEQLTPVADALRHTGPDSLGLEGLDGLADRLADGELLDGLLGVLSEEQREVLVLRFIADLDTAAVGAITGRSPNAVAALTGRGLARIREHLGLGGPEDPSGPAGRDVLEGPSASPSRRRRR
jgi:RNA polymerase sigma-70 factor, ECF subfamily